MHRLSLALVVSLALAVCGNGSGADAPSPPIPADGGIREPALREELLEMAERDQAERTAEAVADETDADRTMRLREIIEEFGWPTSPLVGEDGASAAWLIAQHSDFDVGFQQQALELMMQALEAGEVDPTEVAYLEDRVAVNQGRPQTYGSQIRCRNGRAHPATAIVDAAHVDERRAEVGMEPLDEYLALFKDDCAVEASP